MDDGAEDVSRADSAYKQRLRHANTKLSRDPRTDPVKLLEYLFETLCSLRVTAKTFDHTFLAYLIEMAVLESEQELKEARLDARSKDGKDGKSE